MISKIIDVKVTKVNSVENFFLLEYFCKGEEFILPLFGNSWSDVEETAKYAVHDDTGIHVSNIYFDHIGISDFTKFLN